jgi:lipopolysaccharide export system permease protein
MNPLKFLLLDRYLVREVLRPFALSCGLFLLLFTGYSSARVLADAVMGLLPMDVVLKLIGFKVIIALEVLLPIAWYLAVVMGLGRLHTDSEMVALLACGYGEGRAAWTIFRASGLLAVLVAVLSLELRPWAYRHEFAIENLAKAKFDVSKIEARKFHAGEDYVIFAEAVDHPNRKLYGVFFSQEFSDHKTQVIRASSMMQIDSQGQTGLPLVFEDGYAYELDLAGEQDLTLKFQRLELILDGAVEASGLRSKAAPSLRLWRSGDLKDVAELEWRLSRPASALLLALIAVPLSRTAPRTGRYGKSVLAVIVFAVYYNLSNLARTWVKDGVVGAVPGVFWPEMLLLGVALVLYLEGSWLKRR